MEGFICIRDLFFQNLTTSRLNYNGVPLKFPLNGVLTQVYLAEDAARAYGVKIPKMTCIGEGDYWMEVTYSDRFKELMPLIYNHIDGKGNKCVMNDNARWDGIRSHIGNYEGDTEGCPLQGFTRNEKGVFTSTKCFEQFLPWLIEEVKKWPDNRIPYKIIHQQKL